MRSDTERLALNCWMDAAFQAADWIDALAASAAQLRAKAMCLVWPDSGARRAAAFNAGLREPRPFFDFCRELASDKETEAAGARAFDSGFVIWTLSQRDGRVEGECAALFAFFETSAPDRQAFDRIAAVAQSAVAARARVEGMRRASALQAEALDQLACGIAILDETLVVVEMNEACRAILKRADGLRLGNGRLVCRNRADLAVLSRAVASVLAGEALEEGAIVRISRADQARPYVVRPIMSPCAGNAAPNRCLLMIVDPDSTTFPGTEIWRAMFDLTDCELIIAEGLVSGRRITQIAHQRGVSVETVRTQTKRMFERLSVSSQAEAAVRLSRAVPFRALAPA